MSNSLKLNKKEFKKFLDSLAKINDSAILDVKKDNIHALSSSEDRSMFLWSSLDGDFDFERTLNIQSLQKLSKSLDLISADNIELTVNSNNIEYIGDSIKFKCHLYDDGILPKPKLTLDKIKSFKYDYEFEFTKEFLDSVLKKAAIFKEVSKLYLYTEDDHLVWGLMDKAMTNTDSIVMVGDDIDFEMDEFILNLDNVRLWNLNGDNAVKFRINKMGIGNVQITSGNTKLDYVITSLTK